jgi:hypothetical protein
MKRKQATRRQHETAAGRAGPFYQERVMEENREVRAELGEALGELSPKFREAAVLRHLAGMTEGEVAKELGCPVGLSNFEPSSPAAFMTTGPTRFRYISPMKALLHAGPASVRP